VENAIRGAAAMGTNVHGYPVIENYVMNTKGFVEGRKFSAPVTRSLNYASHLEARVFRHHLKVRLGSQSYVLHCK